MFLKFAIHSCFIVFSQCGMIFNNRISGLRPCITFLFYKPCSDGVHALSHDFFAFKEKERLRNHRRCGSCVLGGIFYQEVKVPKLHLLVLPNYFSDVCYFGAVNARSNDSHTPFETSVPTKLIETPWI